MKKIYESAQKERVIKSIKLEALPHEKTLLAMKEHGAIAQDEYLIEKSEGLKDAVTYATKQHLAEALENVNVDFSTLFEIYASIKAKDNNYTMSDYRKEYDRLLGIIEKSLGSYKFMGFTAKDIGTAPYFKDILPTIIKDAKDIDADEKTGYLKYLENPLGLAALLDRFVITRKTALTTRAAARVMENFEIYANNRIILQDIVNSEYKDMVTDMFPEILPYVSSQYYEVDCLTPDGINGYNSIVAGSYINGARLKGYNEVINEINNTNRTNLEYEGRFFKKLKKLYTQVLFPKEKLFTIETLTCDDDARILLKETFEKASKEKLLEIVEYIKSADKRKVMIHGHNIHTISHIAYANHKKLADLVNKRELYNLELKLADLTEQKKNESDKEKKKELTKAIKNVKNSIDNIPKYVANIDYSFATLEQYAADTDIFKAYLQKVETSYINIAKAMAKFNDTDIMEEGNLRGYHKNKQTIKEYSDALVEFRQNIMNIISSVEQESKDALFYDELEEKIECLDATNKAVNLLRNYMTQKTKDVAKEYPVCFGSPSAFAPKWWNEDAENNLFTELRTAVATIINIDNKYYYCIKGYKQKSPRFEYAKEGEEYYEVLNQKTAQDASKIFPKNVFSDRATPFFTENPTENEAVITFGNGSMKVSREAYEIQTKKTFSTTALKSGEITEKQYRHNLDVLMNLYKEYVTLNPQFKRFTFTFKDNSEYADIGEFFADANVCMLDTRWVKISKRQIDELINSGQMYAFLITNKNMYENGVKTSYAELFLQMMSYDNFKEGNIRLNSGPQITFRPACIPYHITHPKGSILLNKKDANGEYIDTSTYKEMYAYLNNKNNKELSPKAKYMLDNELVSYRVADYDIARDFRYMVDKYFISISYVKNAKVSARNKNDINEQVENAIQKGFNTISVSRGTTDLIYYKLFDENHKVIKAESLNIIGNIDYQAKLRALSKERNEGKADTWNYDTKVNNYKEWYINAAIGRILEVANEYNAIIVIEKISNSFKDKMSCIDNQVYKSFEKKLEARLLDFHRKHDLSKELGSIINPLQLASSNTMGQRNGILFKLNGAYISNMDANGFVNLFELSKVKSQKAKLEFIKKFDSIIYDADKELFVFKFDYMNFDIDIYDNKTWTIYAGKPQTVYDKEKKTYKYIEHPAAEVAKLVFADYSTDTDLAKIQLSKEMAAKVCDLFITSITNKIVKECNQNEKEYFSDPTMPVDEEKRSVADNKCDVLAKKMWYIIDNRDEKDLTKGWLNDSTK